MRAVILAAGMGTRLGRHTAVVPKPLVAVNGLAILDNALRHLAAAGITDTTVVIGHLGEQIRRGIGDAVRGMRVRYRSNDRYATTGTAESLRVGLQDVDDDVLIVEGDVFCERAVLTRFLSHADKDATLLERWNHSLDGSVVELGPDGFVTRWLHKSHRPPAYVLEGTFKTVNVHRLSAGFVDHWLRPALNGEVKRLQDPLEVTFARLVAQHARIRGVEVEGQWVEIDDDHDLRKAESMFA